jgi:glycosidase
MLALPGIPCLYYGSEWGLEGKKVPGQSDDVLRPALDAPSPNDLTRLIKHMIAARNEHPVLRKGAFKTLILTNRQWVFERENEDERVIVAINIDDQPYTAHFNARCGLADDLITGKVHDFGGGSELLPCSIAYWLCER